MSKVIIHIRRELAACVCTVVMLAMAAPPAESGCAAATCFLTLSPLVGVFPAGTFNVTTTYSYAPQNSEAVTIAGALMDRRQVMLNGHHISDVAVHRGQLDFNYGVTDRFTLQLTAPMVGVTHAHPLGKVLPPGADPAAEGRPGLAEVRLTGKYALLTTLRSSIVTGVGVEFPTSDLDERNIYLQAGRRMAFGVVGQVYQTYELIPNRLSQFAFFSYRHSAENEFEYRFGDEYILNGGLILRMTERFSLAGQVNYRYQVHDVFRSTLVLAPEPDRFDLPVTTIDPRVLRRSVPNTGFTVLMASPGASYAFTPKAVAYVYVMIPLVQDWRGNLEQGVSALTGFSYTF
jgi:hypothetical protein